MTNEVVEILLVEDDPKDIRLMLHALRAVGFVEHVDVVRDGEEALDYLFCRGAFQARDPSSRPRLIVLDLKLPKITGLEVLRTIKRETKTQAIPVAIMTSSRQEADLVESYRLGVNSYIQKPVDYDEFRRTIAVLGDYWIRLNQSAPARTFDSLL